MLIKHIRINNFRNIESLDITPNSLVNLIYGPNGCGKTSFLEAISCLAIGRSFRKAKNSNLVKSGEQSFTLTAKIEQDNSSLVDHIGLLRSRNRSEPVKISINGHKTTRLLDIIDKISLQIIHPQGTALISGEPSERRGYLDWGVYYSQTEFKQKWLIYRRLLEQRNALLKNKNQPFIPQQFAVWDDMLANLSEEITNMRNNYLADLLPELERLTAAFLPGLKFNFLLSQGWEKGLNLRDLLSLNLEKDRVLGYTFHGCHRADLKIKVNSFPAGETLSRGQIKLLICAMKLSQGTILYKKTGKRCIYLVDDLNSELDQHSRELLLNEILNSKNQLFITNITDDIQLPAGGSSLRFNIKESLTPAQK